MTDYLSFYAGAMVKALLLPRFDAVVTLTTPPIDRPGRHALEAAARRRGTFTGAWTSIPTPAWHWAGCRRKSLFGRG